MWRITVQSLAVLVSLALLLTLGTKPAAWGQDPPAAQQADSEQSAGEAAADEQQSLSSSQELLARRYKRFVETLRKVAENIRKTDPERAELLNRAIGKSNKDGIARQMDEIAQLLGGKSPKFGDALDEQVEVVANLNELLQLLLSEDERTKNKAEQARIEAYLKKLNDIINKQKDTRAATERKEDPDNLARRQQKIRDQTDDLGRQIDDDDAAKRAAEDGADSEPGESKPGESKPGESKPGESKPGESKPGESKPGESKPGESKPGESKPGESKEDEKKTAGREELERARQEMEKAIDELNKKAHDPASDHQDEVLKELQKAKEKLEEILRQLRDEEKTRFLQALEARFQKMLTMQVLVYDGTVRLDRTAQDQRSQAFTSRSHELSRTEEEIVVEATRALTLLREEGTAVAFPEAVEQMRDDMQMVARWLGRDPNPETGKLTQAVEKEIIDALEEMIEALQKEMEKMKEKEQKEQQNQEGQESDPELVDILGELKLLRSLQHRVNRRTRTLGQQVQGEQAQDLQIVEQLRSLANRQARIQKATSDLATGRNK